LSAQAFRDALAAELGIEVDRINEPLNAAPLYQPHTKRRYQLSDGYWDAVNPARFDLPVARSAYRDGVTLPHKVLLDDEAAPAIADAIARLHQHRQPLAHWTSTGS
jgi:L-glutamine:scyllo-inosose aminotransferase/L-glutamine:2-deoxy-scyllo-inosose/3-amino-2,3-dideoxy-scyllo-inosose aminotransferase